MDQLTLDDLTESAIHSANKKEISTRKKKTELKRRFPAEWPETLMLHQRLEKALKDTGLNYDLSAIQTEHRIQEASGTETEALTIFKNTVFVVRGKRKKDTSFSFRFQKILFSVGADTRKLSDGLRITPTALVELFQSTELAQILYETCLSDADSFSCCSLYEQCSDAKKCIQTDPMFFGRCHYRENLKAGKIFYGKNKTI